MRLHQSDPKIIQTATCSVSALYSKCKENQSIHLSHSYRTTNTETNQMQVKKYVIGTLREWKADRPWRGWSTGENKKYETEFAMITSLSYASWVELRVFFTSILPVPFHPPIGAVGLCAGEPL